MCLGARVFARLDLRGRVRVLCAARVFICVRVSVCVYVLLFDMNALFHVSPTDRINMDIRSTDGINTHTHTTPNGLGVENKGSGANQAHANTQTQTRKRNSHTQKQRAPVQKTQTTRSTAHTDFRSYPGSSHTASKHSNRWSEQV